MYKLLLSLLLGSTLSFAGVINAVAITVNGEPITLYDIDKTMVQKNVSKNKAVNDLIDEILFEQLVKKHNITADVFDVNNYIEKLASTNGMDVYSFKSIIRQQYRDYDVFENEAKKAVIRQKLIDKLVRGQLKIATEEDLKIYYENNKKQFTTAKTIEVTQYSSKSKNALLNTIKNPLLVSNEVSRRSLSLESTKLNPQMQFLLNKTKEKSFTPIFTANRAYNTLYVSDKKGTAILDFEIVKGKIFNDVMKVREKKYLKDYFEKERLTANIKIVR
ncbi:peptidylprolyl isomerase [Malaciobacter sp. WC5094]|uniref:peptidyl-prolyl cis-trans isomerase n=1 Tax=Arcobacter sp. YIC-80 TaxID=3376683 RepID=UPI00384C1097